MADLSAGERLAFGGGGRSTFERRGDTIEGLLAELAQCADDYRLVLEEDALILGRRLDVLRRGRALLAALTSLGGEVPAEAPADFKPTRQADDPVLVRRAYERSKAACFINHRELRYSLERRTVWCAACEELVDALLALDQVATAMRIEDESLTAKKKVLAEYAAHQRDVARRYNERHRKKHPQAEDGCSRCWKVRDNERLLEGVPA